MKVAERFNRQNDLIVKTDDAVISIPVTYFIILVEELLDNSFKFSEKGKKVTITGTKENEHYKLTVTDEGRGMTDEQLANIGAYLQFERDKYEQQGVGLGLTISMKIAEIYGGKMKINSKYGEFTEVTVSLPLVKM
jgi:signal transduction histidine kinase